jgi:hypothetical protein
MNKLYIGFGLLELATYGAVAYAVFHPGEITIGFAGLLAVSTWLIWRAIGGRFTNVRYLVGRRAKSESAAEASESN